MKTTVELPDELMRAVKIRAVNEGRTVKDVMADVIEKGLSREPTSRGVSQRRVTFPLVDCAHEARPDEEMTPDRVAEILLDEDVARLQGAS